MRHTFIALMALLAAGNLSAQPETPIRIDINAGKQIATVTKRFNGTNIEDLNNQTNGGMFSQLIHGEAFEENIDVDFLNLERKDYSKIYVVLDERRIPHLLNQSNVYSRISWNNLGEKYDFNSNDIYSAGRYGAPENLSGWMFPGRFLGCDYLPQKNQKILMERVNCNEKG